MRYGIPSVAATTVTAVTVDLLPSGRVVVRREVVVCGVVLRVVVAVSEPELLPPPPPGATVRDPPPTVVTMVTPSALTLVMTSPELSVLVTRSPWAFFEVMTSPAVSGPVPATGVVAGPALEPDVAAPSLELAPADAAALVELAPGARGEVLVEVTVVGASSEEAETTGVSVVRLPSGSVLVAVAIGATGVTWVVADAEFGISVVLLLSPGTTAAVDVVTVPLLISCRLANATILLAIDASSLCRASAAVLSFSNMPCVNFFGEKSWSAACKDGGST